MTKQTTANTGNVTGTLSETLTNESTSATISLGGNNGANATGAEPSGSEDTLEGLRAVIEQQKGVIDVLTEQVGSFKSQWETAIRQGAAIGEMNAGKPNNSNDGQSNSAPGSLSDDYTYLKDLDYRITKEDLLK